MFKQPPFYVVKTGDVKAPYRAHKEDACIDFFVPNDFEKTTVKPHESIFINLKIKVGFPMGFALILKDKSGIAKNRKLTVLGGVIDSGYKGEIICQLCNTSEKNVIIEPGDKIVQGLFLPICIAQPKIVSEEEYEKIVGETERGTGGHGSTGSK